MSSKLSFTTTPAGILTVGISNTLKLDARSPQNIEHRSQPQAACGARQDKDQPQTPESSSSTSQYAHIDSEDPYYLQELTPNLCIARHAGPAAYAPSGRPFTVFLNIKYYDINVLRFPKKGANVPRGWGPIDGVSRYDLVMPSGRTLLRQFQVGLALHFLTLELNGELPCILITGAPVDSITVAAAYLAFKLTQPIGAIIEAIDSHKDVRKCWKGLLPEEGVRQLSEIVLV